MSDESSTDTRSRTPSISSRQFVIPEDGMTTLDIDNSTQDSIEAEGWNSADQDSYNNSSEDQESSQNNDNSQATLLSQLLPQNNTFFTGNQVTPMFDTSKYLFESLWQALNGVDFSEAISLQTKTSAIVNSKSRELIMLIEETEEKLRYFSEVFDVGEQTARRIKNNLEDITRKVDKIKPFLGRDFPIEYNQSMEKIFDRTL
ncbi:HER073Wp [Eremothecium sinecaudum]|uniref:Biogenesis of lysosome-related organelles complex 1 subunit KXD1 n=1 Tax=Eremothecium sinecaudum TaxID=45286 RepID=A0A0X8HTR0_9SACH|nr:HER073Wp [Eremothecium sinecaudum]AMD21352.1 HER073Wp [Eremothecium sinecaudum]